MITYVRNARKGAASKHKAGETELSRCSLAFKKFRLQLGQRAPSTATAEYLALVRQPTQKSARLHLPLSSKCPLGLLIWILISAQVSINLATSWPAKGLKAVPTSSNSSNSKPDAEPPQGCTHAHPAGAVSPSPAKETGRQKPGKEDSKAAIQERRGKKEAEEKVRKIKGKMRNGRTTT